ncbi:MAG: thiamine phosphate synthase [Betaproteobacteria bacterium]
MISDIETSAQAIVAHHGRTLGVAGWTPVACKLEPCRTPVEQAVRLACRRMAFDDIDGQLIGQAWQRQSERLGLFDPRAWPDQPEDFQMQPWPREQAFATCPKDLGLYAVVPDAAWVSRLAQAGVTTLQLRLKSADPRVIEREVRAAVESTRGSASRLFINDHWQAALEAGAYGVHLGQEDLEQLSESDGEVLRRSGIRLGLSTHGYAEMMRADRFSPSYLALGAVFATTLKRMATAAQGTGRLARYARLMHHYPLVAIGGIDDERLPAVLASGVGSVAVVRAIISAADPQAAAQHLMRRLTQLRASQADT